MNKGAAISELDLAKDCIKSHHHTQVGLKKGPWSGEEDAILTEYVKKHGEGNWSSVQRNAGLMRCGKSCRLRWANHLRPNVKRGAFTPEEERIIIELHAKLGNKWARMASMLPGRTDNDIKNFWNTRMKRRQRAGLPLYPQRNLEDKLQPSSSLPYSSPSSFLTSSALKASYSSYLPLFDLTNFSSSILIEDQWKNNFASFYTNNHLSHQHNSPFDFNMTIEVPNENDSGNADLVASPLSPLGPFSRSPSSSSSMTLHNEYLGMQGIRKIPMCMVHHDNALDLENNISFTSLMMGAHYEPNGLIVPGVISELPSNQTLSPQPRSPALIGTCMGSNTVPATITIEDRRNSGLLDAVLAEARTLFCKKDKLNNEISKVVADNKGKRTLDESKKVVEDKEILSKRVKLSLKNGCEVSVGSQCCDLGSSRSSIGNSNGMIPIEEEEKEANLMDDDLFSLLNFSSSTPLPDWYNAEQTSNVPNTLH